MRRTNLAWTEVFHYTLASGTSVSSRVIPYLSHTVAGANALMFSWKMGLRCISFGEDTGNVEWLWCLWRDTQWLSQSLVRSYALRPSDHNSCAKVMMSFCDSAYSVRRKSRFWCNEGHHSSILLPWLFQMKKQSLGCYGKASTQESIFFFFFTTFPILMNLSSSEDCPITSLFFFFFFNERKNSIQLLGKAF